MTTLIRRILIVCASLVGLYALLGFFLVPYIAEKEIKKNIKELWSVDAEIRKIRFNPFTFQASVEGFKIPGPPGHPEAKNRLEFDFFRVNLTWYPLLKKEIRLKTVELEEARTQFIVFNDGQTNWDMNELTRHKKDKPEESGKDWILTLERIDIKRSGLDFWDYTHVKPLELPLGPLNVTATNISTSFGSKTSLRNVSIAVGEHGHVQLGGDMSLKPLNVRVSMDIKELPMDFLTAYLSDRTYLNLQSGNLDLVGDAKYEKGNLIFTGNSDIRAVSVLQDEIDDPVLSFKTMSLKDIQFTTVPLNLQINEIGIVGLATAVVINKDGSLNYKKVLRPSPIMPPASETAAPADTSAKGASEEPGSKFQYLINKIDISDSNFDYQDLQIRPNFKAHVHNVDGQVSPVSSDPQQKINILLSGQVEAYGKFKGKGFYIPGTTKSSLDLNMNFHNIELTTFTPYSGRFAGYEISKGKLFLDFNYKLVGTQIRGTNHILLDQFTLGNKVESDKAGHWPLKFALALMKDRKGQIKFQLPVEGDVKDPSFSWGNLIWTAIKNLVVKIVALPFDFIASMVGGGKDLQNIYFEPGSKELTAMESEKVMKIAEALADRPQLALEIKGQFAEADVQGLQKIAMEKKLEPLLKRYKGDRQKALEALARSLMKSDEVRQLGSNPENLEKGIAAHIPIQEDELKALALARGNAVMAILSDKKAEIERVYLLAGSQGEAGKPPQVLLNLKEK